MIVLKFGGTSVGTPERIRSVAHLVASVSGRKMLVLSAMSGTTNDLVTLCQLITSGERDQATRHVEMLRSRYLDHVVPDLFAGHEAYQILAEETLTPILDSLLLQTLNEAFTHNDEKQILACGEMMSTTLMALTLQLYEGVTPHKLTALDFMRITHEGRPDIEYIASKLYPQVAEVRDAEALFVTEGYICTNAFGEVDNLHRGGSDDSATLIGEAIHAEEIQIWTDIDGMHNNDPRFVDATAPVRRLHFEEASELAYFGAKILHPTCIQPAKRKHIPVRLLNTMAPEAPGTLISLDTDKDMIKAVAAKDNITMVRIRSNHQLSHWSFMGKVFSLFEHHCIPIDMIASTEASISLTIERNILPEDLHHSLLSLGSIEVEHDMTIVCVVGDMEWENVGFEAQILNALSEIPVRMISYGGSDYNLTVLVEAQDKRRTLLALSDHLFGSKECKKAEGCK